ncbi:MAG TPA: DHA2 family efflux MFS transporter permease subunit [Gammaproteobacteria bacterium]|jgi:DHA2 family multidrug resistance protein|nr:DHA2 family efflux MFS transporter permease subunit [Gammaproteobacteria bacterium]
MPEQRIGSRFLITVAVMSATVMQVLDTTIVNVALPHMQGELGANPDQITWVLTSYLVASGIFMPLTGFFTDRLGQKRYLMISIVGFVIASALCGISTSLFEIVTFRLLQGVFGAGLSPISQSIMVNTFPHEQRGRAMAIWGLGIMVGPILGPTLGGWLTETLNWRWLFYINVPVGIFSMALTWAAVPETARRPRTTDWTGLVLIALGIGGLQFVLDRGNQENWFDSNMIKVLSLLAVFGFVGFFWHSFTSKKEKLFDLRIFKDRNFATACTLMFVLGLSLYGTLVLQPLMLEGLLGYPVLTTGLVMAPRGVASAISMFMVGRLITRVEPRNLVFTGIVLSAIGTWFMTHYNLDISVPWVVWPIVIQGFGIGLIFVPLATVAYATLPNDKSAEAAGMFSLLRTIGSSIGISIVSTVVSRNSQAAWNQLGGHLTASNPALHDFLGRLGLSLHSPEAGAVLGMLLGREGRMIGFVDAFMLIFVSFLVMLPLIFIMKRVNRKSGGRVSAASLAE